MADFILYNSNSTFYYPIADGYVTLDIIHKNGIITGLDINHENGDEDGENFVKKYKLKKGK